MLPPTPSLAREIQMLAKTRPQLPNWRQINNELSALAAKLMEERQAREAQREASQIAARAIEAPIYNNAAVECRNNWIAANAGALMAYARQLGINVNDTDELRTFIDIQRERVLIMKQQREATYTEHQHYLRRMNAVMVDETSGLPCFGELP